MTIMPAVIPAKANIHHCNVNPNDYLNGEPLIYELTSEYTRTSRFKDCVRAFTDHGLEFEDKILLSVLSERRDKKRD